jgi:glycosyltransferase involved in cell wall biosynthesis
MVDVAGYLPDDQHVRRMREASGLFLPLWADEERSVCRFPTKLGEYLATARPVITSSVGAVGAYLEPGYAAFLCPPGDVCAYAEAAERIVRDPLEAKEVGRRGREVAQEYFDFRNYSASLGVFFNTWRKV